MNKKCEYVTANALIVFTLTQGNLAWRSFASLSNVYSRHRCHLEVNRRDEVMSTENERGVKDKKKKIFPQISQDKAIPTVRRFICSSLQRSYGIAIMFLIQTWETLFILYLSGVCFLLLVADFSFLNLLFFVFLWISFSSFLSLFLIIVLFKCSK